jgi:hypothetical protein
MTLYTEVGLSPYGIVSTEYEYAIGERRFEEFVVRTVVSVYLRIRLCGIELILDSKEGVKVKFYKHGVRVVVGIQSR